MFIPLLPLLCLYYVCHPALKTPRFPPIIVSFSLSPTTILFFLLLPSLSSPLSFPLFLFLPTVHRVPLPASLIVSSNSITGGSTGPKKTKHALRDSATVCEKHEALRRFSDLWIGRGEHVLTLSSVSACPPVLSVCSFVHASQSQWISL